MKKKLEADLISIAHRILQLKNKSDINQLYLETQKLYEKLSVLRFVDTHYGEVKPTIGYAEIEKEIESFYNNESEIVLESIEIPEINLAPEAQIEETFEKEAESLKTEEITETEIEVSEELTPEELTVAETKEEIAEEVEAENNTAEIIDTPNETIEEKVEDLVNEEKVAVEEHITEEAPKAFKAAFELSEELETPAKPEAVQISFEDILGGNYNNTLFVKVDEVEAIPPTPVFDAVEEIVTEQKKTEPIIENKSEKAEPKSLSLNEKLAKGINIDLNDQIAFVKHLFGNSNEDYNRVLNQLITFDNFYETRTFIEEMVKPDYNNWEGKADYEERFMDIIEKKFL